MRKFFRKLFSKYRHIGATQQPACQSMPYALIRSFSTHLTRRVSRVTLVYIGCSLYEEYQWDAYDKRSTRSQTSPASRSGRAYWPISCCDKQAGKRPPYTKVNASSRVSCAEDIPRRCYGGECVFRQLADEGEASVNAKTARSWQFARLSLNGKGDI